MSSGWLDHRGEWSEGTEASGVLRGPSANVEPTHSELQTSDPLLKMAIERTCSWLINEQSADGFWVGELEGDTILESEYVLLLAWLGREHSQKAKFATNYILEQQLETGGWAIYPGGPLEISASVKAYLALKLTGHSPAADYMQKAARAIRDAGGAEKVNSFTRYYLALLGIIGYHQCPAVPPELMLIPQWMPFNIYEMSSWSRTIVIPLSILWAYQPVRELPEEHHIDELFLNSAAELPVTMDTSDTLDDMTKKTWINWDRFFRRVDSSWKFIERCRLKPFRKRAVKRAEEWMVERFQGSDGLGAIFPPIIWSVVALRCLGYSEFSPEVLVALRELERLSIYEEDTLRLQPCKSPVWDTAITTIALREAEVPASHPAVEKSVKWLLSKEVRTKGDWAVRNKKTAASGWFFEFNNAFYPDIDDTIMVIMALRRCLPQSVDSRWTSELLLETWSPHPGDQDVSAVVEGTTTSTHAGLQEFEQAVPILNAIWRGSRWVLSMQSKNGGWGAFDKNNTRELFTRVPFADHNAMIDPPTSDISARVLEMFGQLQVPFDHPQLKKAIEYVWSDQEPDGSWYGRWGVHYLYGTWQCLVGMTQIGISADDVRIRSGANWLKQVQQSNGGWGETPAVYDDPSLKGQGTPTASQTAWALLGLMAAGEVHSEAVTRGIDFLLMSQLPDGTWEADTWTGTGFPRVFYLKYHLYDIYFPLMALSQYAKLTRNPQNNRERTVEGNSDV